MEGADDGTVTTREVADLLGCDRSKALALLHAAKVPASRVSPRCDALLWDGARVRELADLCKAGEERARP